MTLTDGSTLTDSIVDVADYILQKLRADADILGLQFTSYGDQTKLPAYPAVCVEPGPKTQEYKGGYRVLNIEFRTFVIVYFGTVESVQDNAQQSDSLAERIETLIHEDPKFGGKVIDSHVSSIEPGYATKQNSIVRSTRVTVMCMSRSILPSAS